MALSLWLVRGLHARSLIYTFCSAIWFQKPSLSSDTFKMWKNANVETRTANAAVAVWQSPPPTPSAAMDGTTDAETAPES